MMASLVRKDGWSWWCTAVYCECESIKKAFECQAYQNLTPQDSNSPKFTAKIVPPKQPANDYQVGGDHYKKLDIQPWDALRAWFTADEWRGYLKGTVIAYLARERDKGGDVDLRKAQHCLNKLLEPREK